MICRVDCIPYYSSRNFPLDNLTPFAREEVDSFDFISLNVT